MSLRKCAAAAENAVAGQAAVALTCDSEENLNVHFKNFILAGGSQTSTFLLPQGGWLQEVAGQLCINHSAAISGQLYITLQTDTTGAGFNNDLLSLNLALEGAGQISEAIVKSFRPGLKFETGALLLVRAAVTLGTARVAGSILWTDRELIR